MQNNIMEFSRINKDAMNGISSVELSQRAVGRCETVYETECLTREQKTFKWICDPAVRQRHQAYSKQYQQPKQHINKSGTAEAYAFVS